MAVKHAAFVLTQSVQHRGRVTAVVEVHLLLRRKGRGSPKQLRLQHGE